ncbi:GIY-YIG nuclease family protein [Sphingomonas pruni]|uniref:GIY-YIG nuclease family protein n=1 Tax=Sphingomonas pruni TaxID=40683 RepID=UPI0008347846|nr:GIY-YIG nuclease family protein [Sphingomonas pruni]
MAGGFVYILANRKHGALYTGVCADIAARMMQHRDGTGSKFCKKYGISRLVYVESHDAIYEAITREKAIKKWHRAWKIALIERNNPDWRDLFFDINR